MAHGHKLRYMDRSYIKEIVSRLCREREEKHISPANASINDIINAVREDVLAEMREMREMCEEHVLVACRTLNGAAIKLYEQQA